MSALSVASLSPFVPSGADYAASRKFFAELGFEELWSSGDCTGFKNGEGQFILQHFADKQFAENYMVSIAVTDLDAWWATIGEKKLDQKFPGVRFNPPKNFPWGREIHFIDLAGVCWHVRQAE